MGILNRTKKHYPNEGSNWVDLEKKRLIGIARRGSRNDTPFHEVWAEASAKFGRSPAACERAFIRFAKKRTKQTIATNYRDHASGTYTRPKDRIAARIQEARARMAPIDIEKEPPLAPREVVTRASKEQITSVTIPLVTEPDMQISPLVHAASFVVAQIGAVESQTRHWKKVARERKEENTQLNMEINRLREEYTVLKENNANLRKRLAQVVKK